MYAFELGFQSDRGDKVGLAIFSGQLEGDALDYAASFETLMSKALRPDFVAFIFPEYLTPSVASFVENEPAFIDNLSRFGARTSVLAYSFNVSGRLIRFRHRKLRPRGLMPDSQALTKCVVERGMQSLAEKHETEIVIQAPPGSRFTKPSGETSDEFIRAAGLANDYVEHQFVAYCLLTRAPARRALRTIYIDTGSIAGIAEAVSYYLFKFSRGVCKPVTYRTFSSYEGLKGEQPDSPESIWVIISASFSNNLGRKICSEWGLASDQVTTVLTYSDVVDDGKGGGAVACIKTLSKIPESRVSGDVRTSVRIIGENFTAEVSAPIPVRLKTAHKPPGMDDFMRVASQRPVISCHRKGGGRVRAIHLDFQATLDAFSQMGDSRLQSWIERAINWYVPRNLGWIIHDSSDEKHGTLLECVQRILGAQSYPKNLRLCDVRDGFDKI